MKHDPYTRKAPVAMKTVTLLIILMIFVIASVAVGAPHLTIKDAAFDFGFVPQHSKISHTFWLYSTGDDSLKILKVVPG